MPVPVVDIREVPMAVADDAMFVGMYMGTVTIPLEIVCVLMVHVVGMLQRLTATAPESK